MTTLQLKLEGIKSIRFVKAIIVHKRKMQQRKSKSMDDFNLVHKHLL